MQRFGYNKSCSNSPGRASTRRRENLGGVGGAGEGGVGATAKPRRHPDPAGLEGIRDTANRQQGQGKEGRREGQGWQEGEEMKEIWGRWADEHG